MMKKIYEKPQFEYVETHGFMLIYSNYTFMSPLDSQFDNDGEWMDSWNG